MHVFVASVHHTGTQFTQKLFEDIGYVVSDKTPKEAGNSCNYFHRCHIADSVGVELGEWLAMDIPIVVPVRHPFAVAKSWLARGRPLDEMLRQYELLINVVDAANPLYLPLDSEFRDRYFTRLRLKVDLKLSTDWAVHASKMKGGDHKSQLEPVEMTAEHVDLITPLLLSPFFFRFYEPEAK